MDGQFADRRDAGRRLAAVLTHLKGTNAIVLALPRGGVPVAYEIAMALDLPLDVFIVRKLGVPGHRELAMGAIASGGARVLNQDLIDELHIPTRAVEAVVAEEERELARREQQYASSHRLPLEGRTVVLVDDGLATGATMRAAVGAVRQQKADSVMVAVPVGARATCHELGDEVDDLVCLLSPELFSAVGQWYRRFDQTSDQEVSELLAAARSRETTTH